MQGGPRLSELGFVIFDADGTLLDSMDSYSDAFSQVLDRQYDVPPGLSRDIFLRTAGMPLDEQFRLALDDWGDIPNPDIDTLIASFWSLAQQAHAELLPSARAVVRELHSAGYTLIVSSGSLPSLIANRLGQAGIKECFRLLLGTEFGVSAGVRKGIQHFDIIREEFSLSRSELRRNAVMVGDGPHDITIARTVGIISIALWTSRNAQQIREANADIYISNLQELTRILSRQSGSARVFLPVSALLDSRSRR